MPIYIPVANRMTDRATMLAFMQQYDFATLISNGPDGTPQVSYTPIMVSHDDTSVTLEFHLARANPHNRLLQDGVAVTAIFHGPHAFISPSWYESTGAVPTWNYAVVHATGIAQAISDHDDAMPMLNRLTQFYDPQHPGYSMDDVGHMLQGIVAYRMPVDTLEGKFKLGQNRPMADRVGMRTQLEQSKNQRSLALAKLMRTSEGEE
jgi:transcriptional regulator